MGHIDNDKVDFVALLHCSTIVHLYHLPYGRCSVKEFTIDRDNRQGHLLPILSTSCLICLQKELICNGLGDVVRGFTEVNEHQVGIITLTA